MQTGKPNFIYYEFRRSGDKMVDICHPERIEINAFFASVGMDMPNAYIEYALMANDKWHMKYRHCGGFITCTLCKYKY